jgi:hypothetical protein
MTTVLSDRENHIVARLVENELHSPAVKDDEYKEELQELLAKLEVDTDT